MLKLGIKAVSLLSVFSLVTSQVWAGEIKIVDQRGLTRAVKKSSGNVSVLVVISPKSETSPDVTLFRMDGVGEELRAVVRGANEYEITDLNEGTWQIRTSADVAQVKIVSK